jgi:hypothetical protein
MTVNHYAIGSVPTRERDDETARFITDVARAKAYGLTGGTYGGPRGRYVVGGFADSVVIRATATHSQRADSAQRFAEEHTGAVGFWVDEATGRTWLDSVRIFDSLADAYRNAKANGEIAFYDREANAEIRLADVAFAYES